MFPSTNEIRVDRTAPTGTFTTFTMPAPTGTVAATPGAYLGGNVTVDGTPAGLAELRTAYRLDPALGFAA
jgi:hypothetical protein